MSDRTRFRLQDIIDAIDQVDALLQDRKFDDLYSDRVLRAAFERFLEILSEASRHIPPELKAEAPEIPWPRIASIGNHLRHAYHRVDAEILWNIHQYGDLAAVREAVSGFLEKIGK